MICISYTSQIHNMATEAPPFFFSPCLSLSLSRSLSLSLYNTHFHSSRYITLYIYS